MATKINTKPEHVETLTHDEAKRKNIPSVEQQSIATQEHIAPKQIRYPRNTDLDPQLVWRGKGEQGWNDLVASARLDTGTLSHLCYRSGLAAELQITN